MLPFVPATRRLIPRHECLFGTRLLMLFLLALFTLGGLPLAQAGPTITDLAVFTGPGAKTNGGNPSAGVTLDSSGNLFGTTENGGANGDGVVYEISKGSAALTDLASFNGMNGINPSGKLTLDSSGNLFGTTPNTVYEIVKGSATITTLATFDGTNGSGALRGVTLDKSGNLFGTTFGGGAYNSGTVFELAHGTSVITDLYSFNNANPANGYQPEAGLTLDSNGSLFGTTAAGGIYGSANAGTVFEIAHGTTTLTSLASFDSIHGYQPEAGVTVDSSGDLFGTTPFGGAYKFGAVYEIAHGTTAITDIASFKDSNGGSPAGGVTLDKNGDLFGTTGGPNGGTDTVYEMAKGSAVIDTLVTFNGYNGGYPVGDVTLDSSGNLFGATESGGTQNAGVVYEIAGVAAPVPEASTSIQLGLLLVVGLIWLFTTGRRRQEK